jgi:signal transduction histidine kinase
MNERPSQETRIAELQAAFAVFTSATATLEREYRALQEHARELREQLDEKHRALMSSLERQRQLEAETLRQGRLAAMGEMAATVAHEVRNPLGAMALFARMLLDEVREQPEARRLAEQVTRCVGDLDRVVTNILDYVRMPAADLCVSNVAGVVDDALAVAQATAGGGVRVVRHVPAGVAWILDRTLLSQALVNLFRNACEAMRGEGVLSIVVVAAPRWIDIVVSDTGPGIPAAQGETIFNPFFTTKARGTGLGLAVARAAVAAHGGSLELLESPIGARFRLRLPRTVLLEGSVPAGPSGAAAEMPRAAAIAAA